MIERLEDIMNEQSIYPMQTSDELFHIIDAALSAEEIEFMLKMGGVGHCLCRFEKELIGDRCRADMPMETCMSVGPAAEYLIEQGISRWITKKEALSMIGEFQEILSPLSSSFCVEITDFISHTG